MKLKEAKAISPPADQVSMMRNSLQMAVFGAVKESHITEIASVLSMKARGGDLKATRLLFDILLPRSGVVQQVAIAKDEEDGDSADKAPGKTVVVMIQLTPEGKRVTA